jgi:hypothetical protein
VAFCPGETTDQSTYGAIWAYVNEGLSRPVSSCHVRTCVCAIGPGVGVGCAVGDGLGVGEPPGVGETPGVGEPLGKKLCCVGITELPPPPPHPATHIATAAAAAAPLQRFGLRIVPPRSQRTRSKPRAKAPRQWRTFTHMITGYKGVSLCEASRSAWTIVTRRSCA